MDRGKDDCMSLRWMGAALIVLGCGGVGAFKAYQQVINLPGAVTGDLI